MVVAFTGYRPEKMPFVESKKDEAYLKFRKRQLQVIERLIERGCTHFISGVAMGFDTWVAEDTKEQLDADTESIRQCARKHLCSLNILRWQQLEGLNTVLPYGVPKLTMRRTLTTESLAVFMPFRVQEVTHRNGIYFANNAISKNMIMVNRGELLNGNSFITGVSGSGKSLLAKQEIINLFLSDKNADIIIIDPEKEYGKICDAFGGECIEISATSKHHINAMETYSLFLRLWIVSL